MTHALCLTVLMGCGTTFKPLDLDGDGLTAADGDCWDAPEGPEPTGPGGADIHPDAEERWYDGVDQDCSGGSDYDQDGDGHDTNLIDGVQGDDCDDLDPASFPDAEEIWYDGVDQDCDGLGDSDYDGDGHDAAIVGGDDCDDQDASAFPGAEEIWYSGVDEPCDGGDDFDQDGDGYASDDFDGGDCDDLDPAISPDPSVEELWYDGIDQDCDGNDGDKDGDGYVTDGYAELYDWEAFSSHIGTGDCWDDPENAPIGLRVINGFPDLEAADLNPGAEETWYDGVDQDCASDTDFDQDGDGYATLFYPDSGGATGPDCVDGSALDDPNPGGVPDDQVYPGAADAWYDGTDADCAGDDDFDQDIDGYSAAGYGVGSDDDCDDTLYAVHPGVTEDCATGYDDDCDGLTDALDALGCSAWYLDADGDGHGVDESACYCTAETPFSATSTDDCDDGDADVSPSAPELCDDANVDEDCDGLADDEDEDPLGEVSAFADLDVDGFGDASTERVLCDLPDGWVLDETDCDDGASGTNPDASEQCDDANVDEDCDGLSDDLDPGVTGTSTWYTDADDDGYGESSTAEVLCDPAEDQVRFGADCDDDDAGRSPGETEICDSANKDEDCDDLADDLDSSATGQTGWYLDADSDGHGSDASVSMCDRPAGYVAGSTDCDDEDPDINPTAREVCDDGDVDENCNGVADDDDVTASGLSVYYADADGDGFGVSSEDIRLCDLIDGYSATEGDCDDTEKVRYPGAAEVCGDGVVNACASTVSEALASCRPEGLLSADATRTGGSSGDALGQTAGWGGDVDGDGYADLLLGSPGATGGAARGIVYLLAGPLASGSATALSDYEARLVGGGGGDQLGAGLSGGLDVDWDGYDDLVLGAPGEDSGGSAAGAAFLLEGPLGGSSVMDDASPPWAAKLIGASAGDAAGSAVALVGDMNGDGQVDLLVGLPGSDDWGSSAGFAALVKGPLSSGSLGDAIAIYGDSGDAAGETVAGAGDVDGDGYDDLMVGAPLADWGAVSGAGKAVVVLGPPSSSSVGIDGADRLIRGAAADDGVGTGLSGAGDIDGDGYDDLLVGAPGFSAGGGDAGAAVLVFGKSTFSGSTTFSSAGVLLVGESDGDAAGSAVAGAGDMDGDGYGDLLVGAPHVEGSSGADEGLSYLIYGSVSSLMSLGISDATLAGGAASALGGSAVAGGADHDADGYDDAVIGIPGASSDEGAAALIFGNSY